MLCRYGANGIFIDVTQIIYSLFVGEAGRILTLPEGPKGFNALFGDPVHGVVKTLIIEFDTRRTIQIDENDQAPHQYELGVGDASNILDLMRTHLSIQG
jgi:hypothetical protein